MTIIIDSLFSGDKSALVITIDGKDSCNNFKEMVQRAANLWPAACPEIKEFADLITGGQWIAEARTKNMRCNKGKGLQDYTSFSS